MRNSQPLPLRFTLEQAQRAYDTWGANCGPGAIAAICGLTLDELRPYLADFERKGYTNPTLMWSTLQRLDVMWTKRWLKGDGSNQALLKFPEYGLARIQWEGPWMNPGVPLMVRYQKTHWIGAMTTPEGIGIFDINAINNGSGWVSLSDWESIIVPWLLERCVKRANGRWHLTHTVEIVRSSAENVSRWFQRQGSREFPVARTDRTSPIAARTSESAGGATGTQTQKELL